MFALNENMCNLELFKAWLAYDISDNVFGPRKFDIINRVHKEAAETNPLFTELDGVLSSFKQE
eukprot:Pgem_evm2s19247